MKRKASASHSGKDSAVAWEGEPIDLTSEPTSAVEVPNSPAPSEISSASIASSSNSNTYCKNIPQAAQEAKSPTSSSFSSPAPDKTITAQTEVLQGGCLPGDVLPIRVSIDHTKPMKSMQGVIITFYRLARIDTHPAIPLGPSSGRKYEDLYPRSRTGLGGLSLSSAGSTRTFRQDLAQNITPLMIDPQTLTAIIKTSVQIPEHVFPTISGTPGSMISFKYFVEIVVDLRGKLGQDRLLPKFSITDTPQHAYGDPRISMVDAKDGVTFSTTPGFNFLITDQIRRQKGVIYTKTEVIIGTVDSSRSKAKQKENPGITKTERYKALNIGSQPSSPVTRDHSIHGETHLHHLTNTEQSTSLHTAIALPEQPEGPLDEKAQIRRAEQTLLPSSPPLVDPESLQIIDPPPSAPLVYDEEDLIHSYPVQAAAPAYDGHSSTSTSVAYGDVGRLTTAANHTSSKLPENVDDDKEELERQRLQALASSPDDYIEEGVVIRSSVPYQLPQILPSAPIPFEDGGAYPSTPRAIMAVYDPDKAKQSPPNTHDTVCISPTLTAQKAETTRPHQSANLHGSEASSELQTDSGNMSSLADFTTQSMENNSSKTLNASNSDASDRDDSQDYER